MTTDLDTIRSRALAVACPYRLPESAVPRAARRRARLDPEAESVTRCGAGVGEACRDPRSGRRLERLPHLARTELADRGVVR